MFQSTFLHQIFCQLCLSLKDFIKIVRLVSAAVRINGLNINHSSGNAGSRFIGVHNIARGHHPWQPEVSCAGGGGSR